MYVNPGKRQKQSFWLSANEFPCPLSLVISQAAFQTNGPMSLVEVLTCQHPDFKSLWDIDQYLIGSEPMLVALHV